MRNFNFPKIALRIAAVSLAIAQACSSEKTGDGALTGTKPDNSSGQAAEVTLQMSTEVGNPSLKLEDAGLDLGNGIVLSDARVNIAKIKLKPHKDQDADEKSMEDKIEARAHEHDEEHKAAESAVQPKIKALEDKYKVLFSAATTTEEKAALRTEFEKEKAALKAEIAASRKADEEAADDLDSANDADLKWKGPFVYNLVTSTISPSLPAIKVFDGTYRRISFKLKANRESTDALLNNSIYVKGQVTIAGNTQDFTFELGASENVKLKSKEGITIDADGTNLLAIAFHPEKWFTDVDFSHATPDASGVIGIDNQNNTKLYKQIRHNIKASTRYGKDKDHDGHLHESEAKGDGSEDADSDETDSSDDLSEESNSLGVGKNQHN